MPSADIAIEHIEKTLREKGLVSISAIGTSMLPLIKPGAPVTVERCPAESLKSGDIVLIKKRGHLIMHRIQTVRTGGREPIFITRGDNNPKMDSPVSGSLLVGKITARNLPWRVKIYWHCANGFIVWLTLRIPEIGQKIAGKSWGKFWVRLKNKVLPGKSVLLWLREKSAAMIRKFAGLEKKLRSGPDSFKATVLIPGIHAIEVHEKISSSPFFPLWNRIFRYPSFETQKDLDQILFHYPAALTQRCFMAVKKDRLLGFAAAYRASVSLRRESPYSLEAFAVDPLFRRRGVGTLLLNRMRRRIQAENTFCLTTGTERLFFNGLHLSEHEAAICFLIKHGFDHPMYFDEMILSGRPATIPKDPAGLSISLFSAPDRVSFSAFLEAEELAYARTAVLARLAEDSGPREHLFLAIFNNQLAGYAYVQPLSAERSPAIKYRAQRLVQLYGVDPNKFFFLEIFVGEKHRGQGIGGSLFKTCLEWTNPYRILGFVTDTCAPGFYTGMGFRKIDRHAFFQYELSPRTWN